MHASTYSSVGVRTMHTSTYSSVRVRSLLFTLLVSIQKQDCVSIAAYFFRFCLRHSVCVIVCVSAFMCVYLCLRV